MRSDGTFVDTERRIQRLCKVWEPLGESRPDWETIQPVAKAMGGAGGWDYTHPSEIMDEVAQLTPTFAGNNYERLEGYKSLQWPVHADGSDEPLLYTKEFPFPGGKASFHPLE